MKCVCGAEFEPRQWNQRYCSDHCQQEDYYRLNRETILEKDHAKRAAKVKAKEKVCPTCGKHFTTNLSCRKYCSDKCRRAANYDYKPVRTVACACCGKQFQTSRGYQRYCSEKCQREDYDKSRRPLLYEKTCLLCGEKFATKYRYQKYCSRRCVLRAFRQAHCAPLKTFKKTCVHCGAEFETWTLNKRYCSKECFRKARNARRPKVELPTRYCAHCGRDFQPTANGQKYCSAECRNQHYKPKTYVKICAYCGAEFNTRRKEQTFCSPTCRRSAEFRQAKLARLGFSSKTPPAKPVTIKPAVEVVKLEPTPEVVEVQAPPVEPPKVVTPAVTAENRKPTVDELLDWIFSKGATV